jgi:hypothetical protein
MHANRREFFHRKDTEITKILELLEIVFLGVLRASVVNVGFYSCTFAVEFFNLRSSAVVLSFFASIRVHSRLRSFFAFTRGQEENAG